MRKRTDSQLEELLKSLPKVTDDRQPNEIYRNIVAKSKKRKRISWILPSAAAGTIGLLLLILSPAMIDLQNEAKPELAYGNKTNHMLKSEESQENTASQEETLNELNVANEKTMNEDHSRAELTSVYPDDLVGHQAFTIPIPDKNAQVLVPITVISEGNEDKTWFEQFEETMVNLSEEEWGLTDYYPLNARLDYDEKEKTVRVDVPSDHPYAFGSTNERMFISALRHLFPKEKVDKLVFTTEGQYGITLGNYGEMYELENDSDHQYAYFFLEDEKRSEPYIVPTEQTFENITEALTEMETDQAQLGLKASLPKDVHIDQLQVDDDNQTLHLKLSDDSKINEEFIYSLEAISLTAKNFGYTSIKLENAGVEQIGPIDLTEEILVPVAPNKK